MIGFIALVREITKQRTTQQQLEYTSKYYSDLYQISPLPYHSLDSKGKILSVNKKWLHCLGYKKDEVIGKSFSLFLTNESKLVFKKKLIGLKKKGFVEQTILQLKTKRGKIISVLANSFAIRDSKNRFERTQSVFRDITKELEQEKKIFESEERLNKAQEIAKLGSWEYDIHSNRFSGSKLAKKIFGFNNALNSVSLQTLERRIVDNKKVHKALIDLIKRNKPYDIVYEIKIPGSKSKKIIHSIAEIHDSKITHSRKIIGTIQDITDNEIMKKKLELEKKRTKKLLDNVDAIVVYLDADGTIEFINKKGAEKLYTNSKNIIGKNWLEEFIPKEKRSEIKNVLKTILVQKGKERLDYAHFDNEVVTKKGNKLLIRWSNSILYDDEKKVSAILSFGTDITSSSIQEKRQQQLLTAVEQAFETVVITDLDGNIQYVNPFFEKTTGYSFDEAIGQNPRILKSGKQDKSFYEELWATITKGKSWRGEFVNVKKNGTEYIEDATISPIFDKHKKIIGYIALKVDITDQKKKEEELKTKMYELEEFQKSVVDRELRMIELEKEIGNLKKQNKVLIKNSKHKKNETK